MEENDNIISINPSSKLPTREDFERLMLTAEDKFNQLSRNDPKAFYKIGPHKLEQESENLIKSVCDGTIFRPEDVKLVSGHAFPDIKASAHFGVEVKSTEGDKWLTTGSSIMENTRLPDIDWIYLLFGKLGSNPPEFKCRPYESVLKEICVTHSPRYTIDMNLNRGETIFDLMGVPFEEFRRDKDKIEIVRNYYKRKNKHKSGTDATQWWIGKESPVNIEIMRRGFDSERRKELVAEMLLLFDEIIDGEYGEAASWLCTCKCIINPSFRDLFSAGGRVVEIDGKKLQKSLPHIVGCILEHVPYIKKCISKNEDDLLEEIRLNWHESVKHQDIFNIWVNRVKNKFSRHDDLRFIDIEDLIMTCPHIIKYSK